MKVNKNAIINLITKSLQIKDKEQKLKVISIFKNSLLMGQNFHFEIKNRHLEIALKEFLKFYKEEKEVQESYQADLLL